MKTTLKVLSVIIKIVIFIFAIIGAILTAAMLIMAKPAAYHVYDVIEEADNLDPDDEDQDRCLTAEAFKRTLADPQIKGSRFLHAVCGGIGKFISFVANL